MIHPEDFAHLKDAQAIQASSAPTTIRPKPYLYRGTTPNGVELIIDFCKIVEDACIEMAPHIVITSEE